MRETKDLRIVDTTALRSPDDVTRELPLSDRAAERLEDGGFIAIQSVKNRDAIRVANLRSLSSVDSSFATA